MSKRHQDIVLFTRYLATLIAAGVPLLHAIDSLSKGQKNPKMKKLLSAIKTDLATGLTFADSLRKHPQAFDHLFCNLIQIAEQSGTLTTMLQRMADHLEKSASLKKKIKKALTYPMVILVVTFLVSTLLLIFIVPQFELLFASFGAQLPTFTRFIINLSKLIQQQGWLLLSIVGISLYAANIAKRRSERFSIFFDKMLLIIPIFGPLLKKAIIARISRTLMTLLVAGTPLIDALTAVSKTANNRVFSTALVEIRNQVSIGQSIHTALSATQLFPNMVTQMIAVGEDSGRVETMLDKIAVYYEEEVDHIVSNLSHLVEPFVMLILGIIVGSFVLALYLPIFKLGSVFN